MREILSGIAGILFLLGFAPYIRAILKGETKPAKASWIIWASLDTITIYGMYLEKSLNGQIIGAVAGAWVVTGLAFKYGKASFGKLDIFCLTGAATGICLMFLNPAWALLTSLTTMFVGAFPTFASTWRDPTGEDKLAWTIYWLSCVFAMLAIPRLTIADVAQPITFFTIESIMMVLLFCRRSAKPAGEVVRP